MNIITIDPSLISTAVVVNGLLFNFCRKKDSHNKSGLSKWYAKAAAHINYHSIDYTTSSDYSTNEILKISDYDQITDDIIKVILFNIVPNEPSTIGIEGYSYSSNAGAIIDLVTFSSLLRVKLYNYVSQDIRIFAPTSLKLESCMLTYPVKDIGLKRPKLEYRNYQGIAGGKFTKREMYLALTDNMSLTDNYTNHLREIQSEMFAGSTIKKPYEDMNDAYLMYHILKNK